MKYIKIIINSIDKTSHQLSKFRTKNWIVINDQSRGVYNTNSDIIFKATMLKSSLYGYSDAHIIVKGIITITVAGDDTAARKADERSKGVILKNFASFVSCKSEINNTEIDNAKDIYIVMPMYNLIEYRDNYLKTSGCLWQYYKDETNDSFADSKSFESKVKITRNTAADDNTKYVEIIVPLKYLCNFWRTLEMPLINCEVNLILTWSSACVITNSTGEGRFEITDTKFYVPVLTLSAQDHTKLLHELNSGFKRTMNWNKYQPDPKT